MSFMSMDQTIDSNPSSGSAFGQAIKTHGSFELSQEDKRKLSLRLNDIEKADPMEYRRFKVAPSQNPHFSITQQDIRDIANLQNVLYDHTFTSHRWFLGPFIVLYKRMMSKFFKKWLGISLSRQFELNQRFLNLALSVHLLENRIRQIENSRQG